MRLAASLLALVAAAPALVSAAPSRDGVSQSAAPSPGDDADTLGFWPDAIKNHIDLAAMTVNFIAKNFEDPPTPRERRKTLPGIHWFPVRFENDNFETDSNGQRVHFLCKSTRCRAERLWEFYRDIWTFLNPRAAAQDSPLVPDIFRNCFSAIWTFLNPQAAAQDSPPVPDILRSADSDRPNFQAEFTNDAVREFLTSVANELSRAARENFDAQNSPYDVADWLYRLRFLDAAISNIHLYKNEPFLNHGDDLRDLKTLLDMHEEFLRTSDPESEANLYARPPAHDLFRYRQTHIWDIADAAKRGYS